MYLAFWMSAACFFHDGCVTCSECRGWVGGVAGAGSGVGLAGRMMVSVGVGGSLTSIGASLMAGLASPFITPSVRVGELTIVVGFGTPSLGVEILGVGTGSSSSWL
ncbi:hypothetical protein BDR06DRAFT_1073278, partial [Suillus hirtellus]